VVISNNGDGSIKDIYIFVSSHLFKNKLSVTLYSVSQNTELRGILEIFCVTEYRVTWYTRDILCHRIQSYVVH